MRKIFDSEKFFKTALILAFIAIIVFIVGSTVAMVIGARYDFYEQFFSELGVRVNFKPYKGYKVRKAPFPEIFNSTIIITGLLLSPLFPSLYKKINPERKKEKIILKLTIFSGIITCISLALVGVFDFGSFFYAHLAVAGTFYFSAMFTCLFWSIFLLVSDERFTYKNSFLWLFDPIVSLFAITVGSITSGLVDLFPDFFDFVEPAIYQKVFVYTIFFLICLICVRFSILLIKERKGKAELEIDSLSPQI